MIRNDYQTKQVTAGILATLIPIVLISIGAVVAAIIAYGEVCSTVNYLIEHLNR